jgi:hypothetical protein
MAEVLTCALVYLTRDLVLQYDELYYASIDIYVHLFTRAGRVHCFVIIFPFAEHLGVRTYLKDAQKYASIHYQPYQDFNNLSLVTSTCWERHQQTYFAGSNSK